MVPSVHIIQPSGTHWSVTSSGVGPALQRRPRAHALDVDRPGTTGLRVVAAPGTHEHRDEQDAIHFATNLRFSRGLVGPGVACYWGSVGPRLMVLAVLAAAVLGMGLYLFIEVHAAPAAAQWRPGARRVATRPAPSTTTRP